MALLLLGVAARKGYKHYNNAANTPDSTSPDDAYDSPSPYPRSPSRSPNPSAYTTTTPTSTTLLPTYASASPYSRSPSRSPNPSANTTTAAARTTPPPQRFAPPQRTDTSESLPPPYTKYPESVPPPSQHPYQQEPTTATQGRPRGPIQPAYAGEPTWTQRPTYVESNVGSISSASYAYNRPSPAPYSRPTPAQSAQNSSRPTASTSTFVPSRAPLKDPKAEAALQKREYEEIMARLHPERAAAAAAATANRSRATSSSSATSSRMQEGVENVAPQQEQQPKERKEYRGPGRRTVGLVRKLGL